MLTTKLRADLAFIRVLILMHCKIIDELKRIERGLMADIATADGSTRSPGEVAAAMARVGADMWQWDGRCRN